MNRHLNTEQWNIYAKDLGYPHIRELLYYYYITMKYTTAQLGEVLGTGKDRATQLLRLWNIPVRKKGGARP